MKNHLLIVFFFTLLTQFFFADNTIAEPPPITDCILDRGDGVGEKILLTEPVADSIKHLLPQKPSYLTKDGVWKSLESVRMIGAGNVTMEPPDSFIYKITKSENGTLELTMNKSLVRRKTYKEQNFLQFFRYNQGLNDCGENKMHLPPSPVKIDFRHNKGPRLKFKLLKESVEVGARSFMVSKGLAPIEALVSAANLKADGRLYPELEYLLDSYLKGKIGPFDLEESW